jgi:hypothetical protein
MGGIRENGERASKKIFDDRNGKPVLLPLGPIALVPVKPFACKATIGKRYAIV